MTSRAVALHAESGLRACLGLNLQLAVHDVLLDLLQLGLQLGGDLGIEVVEGSQLHALVGQRANIRGVAEVAFLCRVTARSSSDCTH